MDGVYSSRNFDRGAYKFTPNVTMGWGNRVQELGFSEGELEKRILDVGCGCSGSFLENGRNIYGIDPNLGILRQFGDGKNYGSVTIAVPERSIRALADELPFADDSFDITLSTKAVGWYPQSINFEMAVREMIRVTRKRTGMVMFNVGQDMTNEIFTPVMMQLGEEEGYTIHSQGVWRYIFHPDFDPESIE
jgi:ubiquinone/menaquinone biosynthesis C-methylase UbiE|tara:strand:+ start:112 stop:684 length:573 start_codon:yes stop_codon:yes gene_type:complete